MINITIEHIKEERTIVYEGNILIDHSIIANYEGKKVGELLFSENYSKNAGDFLIVGWLYINDYYQNMGICQSLYTEFGKIYEEQFKGFPVHRHFVNPVAEYSFKKLIKLGMVPSDSLTEDKITRSYNQEEKIQWKQLETKLYNIG